MRRIWIVRSRAAEGDDELRRLLAEAGCLQVEDLDLSVGALEALEFEPDDACIVLPLSPDLETETELEGMLIVAERRGCSVIAIWPQGAGGTAVPSSITKHADQVIAWDPERLRDCLEGASPVYETPEGVARSRPVTPTNKC